MAQRPVVISGARVLCYINGRLFGRVTSFAWTSLTPRKRIHTIDIPIPVELAATITEVTWQMGVLRTVSDGGMQGAGIVANQVDISKEKYFTIMLIERESDTTLFQADFCQSDQETWNVVSKSVMAGTVSGSGIIWSNEAG